MGTQNRTQGTQHYQVAFTKYWGIDHKPGGSVKLAALYAYMEEAQVDIAALTKCNMAWDKINYALSLAQQTKYWWENAHWPVSHKMTRPTFSTISTGWDQRHGGQPTVTSSTAARR